MLSVKRAQGACGRKGRSTIQTIASRGGRRGIWVVERLGAPVTTTWERPRSSAASVSRTTSSDACADVRVGRRSTPEIAWSSVGVWPRQAARTRALQPRHCPATASEKRSAPRWTVTCTCSHDRSAKRHTACMRASAPVGPRPHTGLACTAAISKLAGAAGKPVGPRQLCGREALPDRWKVALVHIEHPVLTCQSLVVVGQRGRQLLAGMLPLPTDMVQRRGRIGARRRCVRSGRGGNSEPNGNVSPDGAGATAWGLVTWRPWKHMGIRFLGVVVRQVAEKGMAAPLRGQERVEVCWNGVVAQVQHGEARERKVQTDWLIDPFSEGCKNASMRVGFPFARRVAPVAFVLVPACGGGAPEPNLPNSTVSSSAPAGDVGAGGARPLSSSETLPDSTQAGPTVRDAGKTARDGSAPPTCADAAAGVEAYAIVYAVQGGEKQTEAQQRGRTARDVVESRCSKDAWPDQVVACYAQWKSDGGRREMCHTSVSPDALARLKADGAKVDALWAF